MTKQDDKKRQPNTPELRFRAALEKKTLVENLKAGDQEAWGLLMTECRPNLLKAIHRSLAAQSLPRALADEIESDVWLIFRSQIATFQWLGEDKLHNHLASIAHKCVLTARNREQRHDRRNESIDAIAERHHDGDHHSYQHHLYTESAEERADREELRRQLLGVLDRALRELSARDRDIVVARLILRETPADIARRHNLKITNVYQIVNRAKKTMKAYLLAMGLFHNSDTTPEHKQKNQPTDNPTDTTSSSDDQERGRRRR